MYEVESNIPVPLFRKSCSLYPFDTMEVGDSFLAEEANVRSAAGQYSKRHGRKFTTRAVEGGYRVWRIQ